MIECRISREGLGLYISSHRATTQKLTGYIFFNLTIFMVNTTENVDLKDTLRSDAFKDLESECSSQN